MVELTAWGIVTAASLAVCAVALVVVAWGVWRIVRAVERFSEPVRFGFGVDFGDKTDKHVVTHINVDEVVKP